MPQIDWTPEFKRTSTVEFDRLKLKVGERARIVALEKPTFTWVHTLRAPKIVNGEAHKVIKKRADGTEFADWDMDFVGRPQCSGDHGIIQDEGLDPKNCPVCAGAKESEEFQAPDRRFAMNIIKYNTRADGTPVEPFGCSSLVWTFTEGIFNKLYGIAQEYGGLVGRDLVLGPCQAPEAFQKFDITAGAKNLWEMNDQIKHTVTETHKNNRVEDLEAACGRKVEAKWLRRDIDSIKTRWQIANGVTKPSGDVRQEVASLKGELDNLLAAPATSSPQASEAEPTDEGKGESSSGEVDDFSKLLQSMNI
jgi:hypothetical protein